MKSFRKTGSVVLLVIFLSGNMLHASWHSEDWLAAGAIALGTLVVGTAINHYCNSKQEPQTVYVVQPQQQPAVQQTIVCQQPACNQFGTYVAPPPPIATVQPVYQQPVVYQPVYAQPVPGNGQYYRGPIVIYDGGTFKSYEQMQGENGSSSNYRVIYR